MQLLDDQLAPQRRVIRAGDVLHRCGDRFDSLLVLQNFLTGRRALTREILKRAVDRGEIDAAAVNLELWDVLPGYLVYRAVIKDSPGTRKTVRSLVDDFLLPGLRG